MENRGDLRPLVEALRKEVRVLRGLVLVVLACVLVFALAGFQATESKEVAPVLRTNRLELVDATGKMRANLSIDDGPALTLFAADGQRHTLQLGSSDKGWATGLIAYGPTAKDNAIVFADESGGKLSLGRDEGGSVVIDSDEPELSLMRGHSEIYVRAGHEPKLAVSDSSGKIVKTIWQAPPPHKPAK